MLIKIFIMYRLDLLFYLNIDNDTLSISSVVALMNFICNNNQGGKGHWDVFYTSPQSFNVLLFVGFITLGTLMNFDWLLY